MLLVPALAGLMASAQPSKSQSGGSPRVRGEKTVSLSHLLQDGMFTSRARGKDSHSDRGQGWTGITPACAVKSCSYPQQSTSPGDHPHACREKGSSMYCRDSSMGSPPRTRGAYVHPCLRSKSMPSPYAFPAPIPPETAWRKRSASLICRMPS